MQRSRCRTLNTKRLSDCRDREYPADGGGYDDPVDVFKYHALPPLTGPNSISRRVASQSHTKQVRFRAIRVCTVTAHGRHPLEAEPHDHLAAREKLKKPFLEWFWLGIWLPPLALEQRLFQKGPTRNER